MFILVNMVLEPCYLTQHATLVITQKLTETTGEMIGKTTTMSMAKVMWQKSI